MERSYVSLGPESAAQQSDAGALPTVGFRCLGAARWALVEGRVGPFAVRRD